MNLVFRLIALAEIPEFEAHIDALSKMGIINPEQFLSLSMSKSRGELRQLLDISEEEMESLTQKAKENIEPDVLAKLESIEVKEYPLGLLVDDDKKAGSDENNEV